MKKLIFSILLLWATVANAQFNGCKVGFCNPSIITSPPASGSLLADVGNAILVNVGSKMLVQ